ncbi:MAG: hypothetical protein WDN49_17915 [Acetobacteraceae bacterium]
MRGVSALVGACGAIAAWLLWRQLAAEIEPPLDGASPAGRLGLALAWLLPTVGLLWAMLLAQMGARFLAGVFDRWRERTGASWRSTSGSSRTRSSILPCSLPPCWRWPPGWTASICRTCWRWPRVFAVARLTFWMGYLMAPLAARSAWPRRRRQRPGALGGAVAVWCFA